MKNNHLAKDPTVSNNLWHNFSKFLQGQTLSQQTCVQCYCVWPLTPYPVKIEGEKLLKDKSYHALCKATISSAWMYTLYSLEMKTKSLLLGAKFANLIFVKRVHWFARKTFLTLILLMLSLYFRYTSGSRIWCALTKWLDLALTGSATKKVFLAIHPL